MSIKYLLFLIKVDKKSSLRKCADGTFDVLLRNMHVFAPAHRILSDNGSALINNAYEIKKMEKK